MDDKSKLLQIESSFLPLEEYFQVIDYTILGVAEDNTPLPATPIIEILLKIKEGINEIHKALEDL